MSSGFKKLRPVKGLLPSGFTFDYDRGLALYSHLSSGNNMKGVCAIVASGESMEDGKLKAWRRICAERSRGLVMKAWLEKIREKLENNVIERLESFQERNQGGENIQDPVGYFMEYLHQFEKYDFSCLCEYFLSNCESASGDCELKDENGYVACFFYMEYFMRPKWNEAVALKEDCVSISTAMRNKLVRDFQMLASSKASDWKQEQMDEMRRMTVLIFALGNGDLQWKDFIMHPEENLPKCGLDWGDVMSHLFKQK
ncbi:MAG: hypothetical protein IJS08_18890 [Victivallales bacterium]|nr:hypothetical protein [Victivallales bacterium]